MADAAPKTSSAKSSSLAGILGFLIAAAIANVGLNVYNLYKWETPAAEVPKVPEIQGIQPGRIVLGMATDYPPYTKFDPDGTANPIGLSGYNKEFVDLIEPICGIKAEVMLAPWSDCWTAKPSKVYFDEVTEHIGEGINEGRVHGCTAYTHAKGERGLTLEFSHAILGGLKRAGLLTRLVNGKPVVSPKTDDFTNIKIGDVSGWAPTPDTFVYNKNSCTGNQFKADTILKPSADGNEAGINALLNGEFDALYLYADQLENFKKSGTAAEKTLASGLGSTFAFIHTGLNDWSHNGTTLAISKRGSGLKEVLDPCIQKIVATQEYTTMCEKWWTTPGTCIRNEFSTGTVTSYFYDDLMNERTDSKKCADGYCTCDETP